MSDITSTVWNWPWVNIVQTCGVVAALLFTAREMRATTREQRFRNYLDSISGFVDLAKLMVERPELYGLYEYSDIDIDKEYAHLSEEQKSTVHYCDLIIALCETVWVAEEEGWVPKGEWPYWKRWTDDLNKSPYFRWTLEWVKGEYDPEFLAVLRDRGAVA